jgi:hypothetical protein
MAQQDQTPAHEAPRRTDRLCVLALLLATLAVYAPALFGGKALLPADIVPLMRPWAVTAREKFPDFRFAQNQMHGPIFEYYSWRHYARERLHAGEVPLWNPYELGGNVLLANSQSAVLYPPNLLLYLLPLPAGINLVTALHTFLTGFFLFGLLRTLGLRPPAALTGALVWMFCGLQVAWTEFQTPTAALCWLPGALWAWERYAQSREWRRGVFGAGGAVAMTLLAGHLHFAFYVALAFVLYAAYRMLGVRRWALSVGDSGSPSPPLPLTPSPPLILIAALACGLLLSMCTLLPVVEMARMNYRAEKPDYATAVALRLPPENLLTLLLPDLFGNPRDYVTFDSEGRATQGYAYWGKFDYIEYAAYLGIPALILALIGASGVGRWALGKTSMPDAPERERGRRASAAIRQRSVLTPTSAPSLNAQSYFLFLAALGLLLALGTPVCMLFFYGVPGYRQFNATARALCLFSFAMAALAAYGVERIHAAGEKRETGGFRLPYGITFGVLLAGLAAFPGTALVWKIQNDRGQEVARLLTDYWLGYTLAHWSRFLLFTALTGILLHLILRRREPGAGNQESGRLFSRLSTLDSRLIWLLPALAAADLLVWGRGFNPMTDPAMLGYPTITTDFLKNTPPDRVVSLETPGQGIKSFIVPNYNAVAGFREAQGADSLHTRRYHALIGRVVLQMEPGRSAPFTDPNTIRVPALDHPLFDMLNVRYVTTTPERQLDTARFRRAHEAELTIWENMRAPGPAWMVGEWERVKGADQAVARLSAPDFDPRRTALLEGEAPVQPDPDAAGSPARIVEFQPHRITAEVDARGSGLLIFSETAFPGWRATVDGSPAPLLTANYILRAVALNAGTHRVTLTYEPASYRVGLFLICLTLGAMVASLTYRSPRL